MKKKYLLFLLALLLMSVIIFWGVKKSHQESSPQQVKHAKDRYGSYFDPIPTKFNLGSNLPYLPIQVGNKIINAGLDLGLDGNFSFSKRFLAELPEKKYIESEKTSGFRGIEYNVNVYEIPEIAIGNMAFSNIPIKEEPETFQQDSMIIPEAEPALSRESIGWRIFRNGNIFLDLGHAKIAFCDSIDTLKEEGYCTNQFVKSALYINKGFVEFDAVISDGALRCMLDTGATWNILNCELEEGKTIEQVAEDPAYITIHPEFKIDGRNFGPLTFHRFPLKLPRRVEAVLGMEFFLKHIVFIDFSEDVVYFAPAFSDEEKAEAAEQVAELSKTAVEEEEVEKVEELPKPIVERAVPSAPPFGLPKDMPLPKSLRSSVKHQSSISTSDPFGEERFEASWTWGN